MQLMRLFGASIAYIMHGKEGDIGVIPQHKSRGVEEIQKDIIIIMKLPGLLFW